MDGKKLEAFVKAVDLGSISRAAIALHLTQSALSQQITSLEASVGVQLLARSKQGVFPTQAGRVLYRHAQHLLRGMDEALAEVRARGDGPSGRVSVGLAPYSLAQSLTIPLLQEVRREYPNIVLHIRENFGGLLSEGIATGQIDMGILYSPVSLRAVQVDPLFVDELCVIAHEKRRLPSPVSFAELTEVPMLLPTRQHSIRLAVDAGFQRHDLFPRIAGEVESVPSLLGAVKKDIGCTVLPLASLPDPEEPTGLVRIPFAEPMPIRLAFCTSSNEPLSEPAVAVERILRRLVARQLSEHAARVR